MKILYAGFKGKNNPSSQLVSLLGKDQLLLTNSFEGIKRDIDALEDEYDYVIMFGIDKTLSSVRIEIAAEYQGHLAHTVLSPIQLAERFSDNDVDCTISEEPTHYLCNDAYYRMLQKMNGKAIFIHIPGNKNMTDVIMAGIVNSLSK